METLATHAAKDHDFDFAWSVYSEVVRPLIEPKLNRTWTDSEEMENFREVWNSAESQIITLDGVPIGWGAAKVTDDEVEIYHLYISDQYRGKDYATTLLSELLQQWKAEGKTVRAPVLKDERLIPWTERLGGVKHEENDLIQIMVVRP